MGRRNINDRNVRTLSKGATSYYVTIPIEAVRDLEWKKGQRLHVEIDTRHKELVVRDWGRK
jgi:bifunctional DNA-binding transcriptional regulator/antitoxin component of YhaV-PrlF toxin-antitoxin module